jgi:hypothetical protein
MTSVIYRKRIVVLPLQGEYAAVLPYTYIVCLGMYYLRYVCSLNIVLLFDNRPSRRIPFGKDKYTD